MHSLSEQFAASHPGGFFLDAAETQAIQSYLRARKLVADGETVQSAQRAGEGNMNCTLRVEVGEAGGVNRTMIVKQSRPWVEKYPQIEAPEDRALSEARFYLLASPCEQIASQMPKLIDLDTEARVLVLEDVGQACDFTGVYRGDPLPGEVVRTLAGWLSMLHGLHHSATSRRSLANREMRLLNLTHIFHLPLDPANGLDLDTITPGLQQAASVCLESAEFVARVRSLGELYLSDGHPLLHGDFYPGSWLSTEAGPIVIDPEFAFFGRPEFDVGVLLGHLHLSQQRTEVFDAMYEAYEPPEGFDWSLAISFAGCEIMRRLLGVAQLPLTADLQRKTELLALSVDAVLRPGDSLPSHVGSSAG